MKKLLVNLYISKLLFTIIAVSNFCLPLVDNKMFRFSIFQLTAIGIWAYGLLSQLGYFKVQVSDVQDGKVFYESKIPIMQIGILRMVEAGVYFATKRDTVDWRIFAVLVVMDAFYTAFLLLDKANYYFESEDVR